MSIVVEDEIPVSLHINTEPTICRKDTSLASPTPIAHDSLVWIQCMVRLSLELTIAVGEHHARMSTGDLLVNPLTLCVLELTAELVAVPMQIPCCLLPTASG